MRVLHGLVDVPEIENIRLSAGVLNDRFHRLLPSEGPSDRHSYLRCPVDRRGSMHVHVSASAGAVGGRHLERHDCEQHGDDGSCDERAGEPGDGSARAGETAGGGGAAPSTATSRTAPISWPVMRNPDACMLRRDAGHRGDGGGDEDHADRKSQYEYAGYRLGRGRCLRLSTPEQPRWRQARCLLRRCCEVRCESAACSRRETVSSTPCSRGHSAKDPPEAAVDGVEETGVQAAVGIACQVNPHGHGLVGRGHPRGSPDVFVHAERLHATDPSGNLDECLRAA
jgi:hypothetical protein